MESVLEFAHTLLKNHLSKMDNSIDMTVGNGNDTLFLASISNHVYGFDIQTQAIEITTDKLKNHNVDNVSLFLDSHENIDHYNLENIKDISSKVKLLNIII